MSFLEQFKYRTNPNAEGALKNYGDRLLDTIPAYTCGWAIDAGVTTLTITESGLANNNVNAYTFTVTDQSNNQVEAKLAPAAIGTPVAVNVSTLNAGDDWTLTVRMSKGLNTSEEIADEKSFNVVISGNKASQSGSVTDVESKGTLEVYAQGIEAGVVTVAKALVADNGTIAMGNIAQNDAAAVRLWIKNTSAVNPLQVQSITVTGNASAQSAFAFPPLPQSLGTSADEIAEKGYWEVVLDTSIVPGALAAVITILNNTTNSTYVVNVSATIV